MVNILVPTDFSELSGNATRFAIKIANKLNGTVTLVHVMKTVTAVRATMQERIQKIETELTQDATEKLNALAHEFSKQVRFTEPIKLRIAKGAGPFEETLKKEAKRAHAGLIIMGTHGASGLKKVMMGSNTTAVIASGTVPVMAIPKQGDFKGFRNVIYATNLKNAEKELKLLIPYVEKFNATLHLVHVTKSGDKVEALEEKIDKIVEKADYKKIVTMVLVDSDVDAALAQYINISKSEMLAMFTRKLSFYEKLFDRSVTRRMAFHSTIPLLAFKQ